MSLDVIVSRAGRIICLAYGGRFSLLAALHLEMIAEETTYILFMNLRLRFSCKADIIVMQDACKYGKTDEEHWYS